MNGAFFQTGIVMAIFKVKLCFTGPGDYFIINTVGFD
jgi:hypothetical protein